MWLLRGKDEAMKESHKNHVLILMEWTRILWGKIQMKQIMLFCNCHSCQWGFTGGILLALWSSCPLTNSNPVWCQWWWWFLSLCFLAYENLVLVITFWESVWGNQRKHTNAYIVTFFPLILFLAYLTKWTRLEAHAVVTWFEPHQSSPIWPVGSLPSQLP